jgi:protein-tyrosine-phosphatase
LHALFVCTRNSARSQLAAALWTRLTELLCVHNAGRSQMALAWFKHLAGDRAIAWSGDDGLR